MKTSKVVVGNAGSQGASMMMSKGSSMAEKTRQMQKEGGPLLGPPVSSPGLPGLGQRMIGERVNVTKEPFTRPSVGTKDSTTPVDIEEFVREPLLNLSNISPMPIDRVDDHVYIGNRIGAEELTYLKNNKITHIINTANEIPNYHESTTGIRYMKLTLNDDPRPSVENLLKMLEPTYSFIVNAISSNPNARILVHCAAGISRSASIVIYYLMKKNLMSFETATEYLKKHRQWINPNAWYCSQLKDAQTIIENESGKLL